MLCNVNQFMRDRKHAEKRKREGGQGGAEGSPLRRGSRFTNDSNSASAEATSRKRPSPIAATIIEFKGFLIRRVERLSKRRRQG
jgi:hypothetical protein